MQKTIVAMFCALFLLAASFFGGVYIASRNNQATNTEYENRLESLAIINRELQNENTRIANLNRSIQNRLNAITDRIATAGTIIDGLARQAESDGDAIQRIINSVSILEQALSVILDPG